VTEDLRKHLQRRSGQARERYWVIFEQLREELATRIPGALQRYRTEYPHELHLLTVSGF